VTQLFVMRAASLALPRSSPAQRSAVAEKHARRSACRFLTAWRAELALCGLLAGTLLAASATLQAADEDFHVFTDAPRLFLTRQRLRLLQRERERDSVRWQQFDALVVGGAPMPEAAVAQALYYQVSGNVAAGRKAVEWALSPAATDLRQLALIFDWCGKVMTPSQADALAAKIERGIAEPAASDIPHQAARALAAIAIADRLKDQAESILRPIVEIWWRGSVVSRSDKATIPREQTYSLLELLHALSDNVSVDLRESLPLFFKNLPLDHLMGHYPASFRGPDNDFLVPVFVGDGEPDPKQAVWSRAAGFAMVALDPNSQEIQYLQGWLMQDRYLMRDPLGVLYEFLWANPYQPGLSYELLPLVFHDTSTGHVFARTSWDEDATWIGYFEGHLQVFRDGKLETLRSGVSTRPVRVGDAVLLSAPAPENDGTVRFAAATEVTVVLGLAPRSSYDIEIDDEELGEGETDAGGTLVVALPAETEAGVRIRKRP
jgi:hypothetical protein